MASCPPDSESESSIGPVLVVEDEELTAEWIESELNERGFKTQRASDFQAANALLSTTRYAAVVLDIMIPPGEDRDAQPMSAEDVDSYYGLELLRRIRTAAFEPGGTPKGVPVFVVTAVEVTETSEAILSLGPQKLETKPVFDRDIAEFVKLYLEKTT